MNVRPHSLGAPRCAIPYSLTALVLCLTAPQVRAQTPASSASAEPVLPTVFVTATKQTQPLLGAPSAITVLTTEQLESARVRQVEDLSQSVPNLKLDNGYGAGSRGFLSIRGVGNTPGSIDPSASIYIDDIPYHDFNAYSQALFDVRQVEVLKGSQGTLYGGFAQAGVIDIRSNLPGREVRRQASVDAFSPKNVRSSVSLSGPVSESPSLGLSALDERGESFVKNVTLGRRSDRQQNALRLQGVLTPNADTEVVLTLLKQRQRNDGGADYLPVNRSDYNSFAGVSTGDFEIANNIEGFQNLDTNAQSIRLKRSMGAVEYTLVASNRDTKSRSLTDFNYGPDNSGFLFASQSDDRIENQHLEFRARRVPQVAEELDVTAGASVMKQSYKVFNTVNLSATTYDIISAKGDNVSVFANGRLPLGEAGLALIGGARYERAQREGQNGPSDFRTAGFGNIVPRTVVDSSQLTWKLGLSKAAGASDVYAHVSTGWRPGGVNYYTEDLSALTFKKERSITYELGLRQSGGGRFLSAAAFFTRLTDYQESKVAASGTPGRGYLANVATVHIPGFEVELVQALGRGLTFLGHLGYARARFEKYPDFASLEGRPLGNRPDWNLRAELQYQAGSMTYSSALVATDDFFSAYTSSGASTRVAGHTVLNLGATYKDQNKSFTFFIDNLTDKQYFLNAGYYNYGGFFSPKARGQVGAPRTIGVKAKVDF